LRKNIWCIAYSAIRSTNSTSREGWWKNENYDAKQHFAAVESDMPDASVVWMDPCSNKNSERGLMFVLPPFGALNRLFVSYPVDGSFYDRLLLLIRLTGM
jgi:hypothetical protein